MTIRRLFGTATADLGVFWEDKLDHKGWRVQYNHALDMASPLKPYRMLDPKGHLWASADTLEEFAEAIPTLCTEFAKEEPLFSSDDAKDFARLAATTLIRVLLKKL